MKTIVALFDTFPEAQNVVRNLEASGFSRDGISIIAQRDVLAGNEDEGSATASGAVIGAGFGLLAGLAAVTVPGIGMVAALGPIIAGGIVGAVAGGLVGSLVDAGVPAEQAEFYTEGVRRGGTLVTLVTRDEDAPRAVEVINRHNPVNLNERVIQWRESGWTPGEVTGPATQSNAPDASGQTTMGDEVAAMTAPTPAIPAPGIQPTREIDPSERADTAHADDHESRVDFSSIRL